MSVIELKKSSRGWIIELPDDFAEALGQEKGSIAVMYAREGNIDTEIIPPPRPALQKAIDRIYDKYKGAFAEMKRLGD